MCREDYGGRHGIHWGDGYASFFLGLFVVLSRRGKASALNQMAISFCCLHRPLATQQLSLLVCHGALHFDDVNDKQQEKETKVRFACLP